MSISYEDYLGDSFDPQTGEFDSGKAKEQVNESKDKFNIILMGATGVGKSSLVNAFFGEDIVKTGVGKPVTQHLQKVEVPSKGMTLWDTKGIESKDYKATLEQLRHDLH
ncbi:GTPase [Vibrio parahaemolyticus]|nr:GTPase [Vibrio parahaemolyticus]MCR9730230.1 50S ribosome-binding GTPase [Vibrio parahaemolyticus]MCR9751048.1 50S ribosome-binding GTPase [Vibrio parahaemolyticus]MCR9788531.1 50S ribosome-binding GTPase [Vibrio parahaemolyticus]MCR9861983.1 50S ribosome-binding GTPase [Vibrio parahaemolyticus]